MNRIKFDKKLPVKIYSFFKEGLNDLKESVANTSSDLFRLPQNNFLKDAAQMEKEFKEELDKLNRNKKESEYYFILDGKIVEANEVLRRPMEENY